MDPLPAPVLLDDGDRLFGDQQPVGDASQLRLELLLVLGAENSSRLPEAFLVFAHFVRTTREFHICLFELGLIADQFIMSGLE